MDGIPTVPPNESTGRMIAFGDNFMPFDLLYYDEYEYDSGAQVWKYATGDNKVNIEFLTEDMPG